MLRFAFRKVEGAPVAIDVALGYLVGANDQSLAGEIRFEDGTLECRPAIRNAAALNLQCEVQGMGRLSLSTCLLEQRREPYSLLLELARHRIKHFIAKCEDWQSWDHPGAGEAIAQWNQARLFFTTAMTTQDTTKADELSSRALIQGLQASERLAVAHSNIWLHRRYGAKAASKMVLGVRVDPRVAPTSVASAASSFDMIGLPISWAKIERTPGRYDFGSIAPWVDWATKAGRTILVGPVIDLSPSNVPEWIAKQRGDFAALRDGVWKFADAVGRELAGRTGMWNISCGMNDNDWWSLDLEQMVELSRRIVVGLRQSRKNVPTLLEIPRPFGHDVARRAGAVTPRALVEALVNEGIHLDCLMLQFVMGENGSGRLTRDLLEISSLLDSYRPLRKSLFVALGAPSNSADDKAGYWRTPWTAKSQAVWASRMFSIAMSKPHVGMVVWESLIDDDGPRPPHGVLDASRTAKPILEQLISARRALAAPIGEWKMAEGKRVARPSVSVVDALDAPSDE